MIPLVAVAALAPLLIAPRFSFYYDVTPKLVVLLLGSAAACIAWARAPDLPRGRLSRWWAGLLAAQAASLALATAWSVAPSLSLGGSNWRRFGAVAQLALVAFAYLAARRRHVRPLVRAIAGAGIPVSAYAVLQYFGWDPWLPRQSYLAGEGPFMIVRPPGTLGHADYLGTYCVFVTFAGAGLALDDSARGWRIAGSVAAALGVAACILSGTRAAMLGLAAGAILLALCVRSRVIWRALAAAVLLAIVFFFSPAGARLRSRAHWAAEDPAGGARPLLWRDSLRMISARWALGYGPETFPLVFPRFQSEELARAYPDFYHESPHNMFLDAAAAQGVPGLVVLAALCVVGFRAALRARISEPRLAGALAAAFAGGLVSQQFSALILPTALCLYLCAGLLVALADIEHAAARSRWLAVPAVALAAVFCLAAAQIVLYDRALFRVRRNLDAANLDEAVRTWTQARPRPLTGEGADLWYSRKLASAIQPGQNLLPLMAAAASAMEAAVHATRDAADRQNAWYNLAQFQALRNDPAAMEASLRAALECAPNWYKPHWALARLLRQTGRIREASAEAALVLNLGGGRNPEVRRSLEGL